MTGSRHLYHLLCVCLVTGFIVSCHGAGRPAGHDFFAAKDGVMVDDPIENADGSHFLPIRFKTRIAHSGQYVGDAAVSRKGNIIRITALVVLVQPGAVSLFDGVELGQMPEGEYLVQYLDPDGNAIPLRRIRVSK